jgi:hypothetical protein
MDTPRTRRIWHFEVERLGEVLDEAGARQAAVRVRVAHGHALRRRSEGTTFDFRPTPEDVAPINRALDMLRARQTRTSGPGLSHSGVTTADPSLRRRRCRAAPSRRSSTRRPEAHRARPMSTSGVDGRDTGFEGARQLPPTGVCATASMRASTDPAVADATMLRPPRSHIPESPFRSAPTRPSSCCARGRSMHLLLPRRARAPGGSRRHWSDRSCTAPPARHSPRRPSQAASPDDRRRDRRGRDCPPPGSAQPDPRAVARPSSKRIFINWHRRRHRCRKPALPQLRALRVLPRAATRSSFPGSAGRSSVRPLGSRRPRVAFWQPNCRASSFPSPPPFRRAARIGSRS